MVDSIKCLFKINQYSYGDFPIISMALVMFSIKSIRASAVELFFLNPYWELLKRLYLFINESSLFSNTFSNILEN